MFCKTKIAPLLITLFCILLPVSAFAGITNYHYDDLHRLTRVERSDGTIITYKYDNLGNRISKNVTIPIIICDTNGDSKVDITDVVLSLQATCGLEAVQQLYLASDVNGDGRIGVEEAIYAMRVASGMPTVGTVTSAGQIWMDRNLGASQVAMSSTDPAAYGDLYQWGRLSDGHEKRTSGTVEGRSTTSDPGHNAFIINDNNWLTPQDDSLWQGLSGINNPCPQGFRLPTIEEFQGLISNESITDAATAYNSPLKLVMAGSRGMWEGSLGGAGTSWWLLD